MKMTLDAARDFVRRRAARARQWLAEQCIHASWRLWPRSILVGFEIQSNPDGTFLVRPLPIEAQREMRGRARGGPWAADREPPMPEAN